MLGMELVMNDSSPTARAAKRPASRARPRRPARRSARTRWRRRRTGGWRPRSRSAPRPSGSWEAASPAAPPRTPGRRPAPAGSRRDQHREDDGKPAGHAVPLQPGQQRMDRDDDHQRQEGRPDDAGSAAQASDRHHNSGHAQQHQQPVRQRQRPVSCSGPPDPWRGRLHRRHRPVRFRRWRRRGRHGGAPALVAFSRRIPLASKGNDAAPFSCRSRAVRWRPG
jgi:hypothetical protein